MRPDRVQSAVGRLASASKKNKDDPVELEDARQELLAARLDRAITAALHPPEPYKPLGVLFRKDAIERLMTE